MPEFHLKQQKFSCTACGPFTKHRQKVKKLKETGILKNLCRMSKTSLDLLMLQYILIVNI